MRTLIIILSCCFSLHLFAQEQQLALQYYKNGDYEKAASIYNNLNQKFPYNTNYTYALIDCYEQLEKFKNVENVINNQLKKFPNQEYLYIKLGYNYQLQHLPLKANENYIKALNSIEKNPSLGYLIGKTFQESNLLDFALKAYKKSMKLVPTANYNFQIASIYSEQGNIEKMFNTYLNLVSDNEKFLNSIKNHIGRFVSSDAESENNLLLKKLLIKRSQNHPTNSWNILLSWLYLLQNDYQKAFIQEKALFKRNNKSPDGILKVGKLAYENNDFKNSKNCFNFVIENSKNLEKRLISKLYLLKIDIDNSLNYETIESQFQDIFKQYGKTNKTLNIQIAYADFLAFKKNEPSKAKSILKKTLNLPISEFEKGEIKIKLADILVYTGNFNTALIYYTQVQNDLKNQKIGQAARFKIAQTSYFKGDFEWAQTQLKVLKKASSQLIANDALSLNLLITDNTVKDSLKIALKTYAKADMLFYQHKFKAAIDTLQTILLKFKGHPIEDEALFKQAKIFEKIGDYKQAEINYLRIIKLFPENILADNAIFNLATLYQNKLNNTEKAQEYFQKIIFEYPSSIFLVEARKNYRKLRGDLIN